MHAILSLISPTWQMKWYTCILYCLWLKDTMSWNFQVGTGMLAVLVLMMSQSIHLQIHWSMSAAVPPPQGPACVPYVNRLLPWVVIHCLHSLGEWPFGLNLHQQLEGVPRAWWHTANFHSPTLFAYYASLHLDVLSKSDNGLEWWITRILL